MCAFCCIDFVPTVTFPSFALATPTRQFSSQTLNPKPLLFLQIEKQLSNSFNGTGIQHSFSNGNIGPRAATPSTEKQRVNNDHAAAAAASPLARINEDDDEVASPDLNAKLEVCNIAPPPPPASGKQYNASLSGCPKPTCAGAGAARTHGGSAAGWGG